MKFKIRCESIKEFDPQKGAYVKCNREVEVDSAQVGSLVRCPACGNDFEVIDPSLMGSAVKPNAKPDVEEEWKDDPLDLSSPDPDTPDSSTPDAAPADSADENKLLAIKEEPVVDLLTELPPDKTKGSQSAASSSAPAGFNPANSLLPVDSSPVVSSPEDLSTELKKESYDRTSGAVLQQASFDHTNSCHKCGTLLEEKQPVCPNCQTARRAAFVEKKDRKPFSKKGPFGFQLWLDSITKGKKPEDFDWLSGLSYVFAIIFMGSGLTFFIFAGIAGKIVGPLVAFFGYALFVGLRYWAAARKNPKARIPFLGQVTWTVMLFLVRNMQFQKVSKERSLNKNGDEDFGDRELAAMKDLAQYKVIDLEGTNVSDEGLLYLYDQRGIHYLVLRNSKVSEDAAQDLQQTIPKTWIWY